MADHDLSSGAAGDELKPTEGVHGFALRMNEAAEVTDDGVDLAGREGSPEALR
jgi:hypothetical protein